MGGDDWQVTSCPRACIKQQAILKSETSNRFPFATGNVKHVENVSKFWICNLFFGQIFSKVIRKQNLNVMEWDGSEFFRSLEVGERDRHPGKTIRGDVGFPADVLNGVIDFLKR
jgi:hypothetical protein